MEGQESKHDRFKRLAGKRVQNAIKKIELIGNLSSAKTKVSDSTANLILQRYNLTL